MLIPSIMRRFDVYLIAEKLSTTILKEAGIRDLSLIVTAIIVSSVNDDANYQRLEFLGDSILKLCTSVQLMAEYPLWHEGYLSARKDRFISIHDSQEQLWKLDWTNSSLRRRSRA